MAARSGVVTASPAAQGSVIAQSTVAVVPLAPARVLASAEPVLLGSSANGAGAATASPESVTVTASAAPSSAVMVITADWMLAPAGSAVSKRRPIPVSYTH